MGGVVASRAFLPPPSSYDDQTCEDGTLIKIPSRANPKEMIPAIFYRCGIKDSFTIIFSHGNAEDIGQMSQWLQILSQSLRVNVVGYDYRGYGLHEGEVSETSCYVDIESVYDYLVKEEHIPKHKIILFGRSLGSGPTTNLSSVLWERYIQKRKKKQGSWDFSLSSFSCFGNADTTADDEDLEKPPIAGVILQSPIASAIRVVSDTLAMLPIDIFVNIDKIHKIQSPIFIIHGTDDLVVPYSHGKALLEKSGKFTWKFLSLDGAGHNNIEMDFGEILLAELGQFIEHISSINELATPRSQMVFKKEQDEEEEIKLDDEEEEGERNNRKDKEKEEIKES